MSDLKHPVAIISKGLLFALLGVLATVLVYLQGRDWRTLALHLLGVWAFCRFYYFAFYVIEHYVDPSYRFAGLWDVAKYLWRRRRG